MEVIVAAAPIPRAEATSKERRVIRLVIIFTFGLPSPKVNAPKRAVFLKFELAMNLRRSTPVT